MLPIPLQDNYTDIVWHCTNQPLSGLTTGFDPPLKQTADVLLRTDIPFDDEHLNAFEEALWAAMWEQNPHWKSQSAPAGLPSGWSHVMAGLKIQLIPENQTMAFAWHIPSRAWFTADGESCTVDIEQAGQFTNDEVLELQAKYPGERYSMVMPKLVREVFGEDGPFLGDSKFEVRYDEYVLWGYGERRVGYDRVSPSVTRMGSAKFKLERPFKLPEGFGKPNDAREYERKTAWAWRLFQDDSWHLTDSVATAEAEARAAALAYLRQDGGHDCSQWLAITHNRSVIDATVPT